MSRWDDSDVDSDGDELLDWLWDLPDRYDVGIDDDPFAPGAVGQAAGLAGSGVTKHLRQPGEDHTEVLPPEPVAQVDDWPTQAMDPVEPITYAEDDAVLDPILLPERRFRRFTPRDLLAAAAVLIVVLTGFVLGRAIFNGSGNSKPSNLAIGTQDSTIPAIQPGPVSPVTSIPTTDSSSTTSSTSVSPPASSVPGSGAAGAVGAATTTTTAAGCATTCATKPVNPTTPSLTTTTRPRVTTTTTAPPVITTTTSTTSTSTTTTTTSSTTTSTTHP